MMLLNLLPMTPLLMPNLVRQVIKVQALWKIDVAQASNSTIKWTYQPL